MCYGPRVCFSPRAILLIIGLFLPGSSGTIRPYDLNEHYAMRVDRANFEQARRELEGRGIPFKVWDHTICLSLCLFDPDGNQIEVTTFEVG